MFIWDETPRILTYITVSGPIDVFGVIWCRSEYRAVADDATQDVYLIVHLVWHMVRTPVLPLSPGRPIFSLIRRNISSFWDEYFISLMSLCDVDIASTRRLASARCHIQRVAFKMWLDCPGSSSCMRLATRSLSTHVANSIVTLSAKLVALSAKRVALSAKLVQR